MTRRSGRRPGNSGTREAIIEAARQRFSEVGFDKASVRSIAAKAGVDPALVHHYFGTKQDLFVAAVAIPIDPAPVLRRVAETPLDRLGEGLIRNIVGAWDSPAGVGLVAAFRSVVGGGDPALIRTFLLDIALRGVRERVDSPPGSGLERITAVATQMLGILVMRKIVELEPIASMSHDDLVRVFAPTLQHYLTGTLSPA